MTIKERVQKPTPRFFRKLRNTGMVLAAVSASLLAAPVALPAIVLQLVGYLAVAGTITATVSQAVTSDNAALRPLARSLENVTPNQKTGMQKKAGR